MLWSKLLFQFWSYSFYKTYQNHISYFCWFIDLLLCPYIAFLFLNHWTKPLPNLHVIPSVYYPCKFFNSDLFVLKTGMIIILLWELLCIIVKCFLVGIYRDYLFFDLAIELDFYAYLILVSFLFQLFVVIKLYIL